MITKTKPASTKRVMTGSGIWRIQAEYPNGYQYSEPDYGTIRSGADTITYEDGPKYTRDHHCNWKACHHTKVNVHEGLSGSTYYDIYKRYTCWANTWWVEQYTNFNYSSYCSGNLTAPSGAFDYAALAGCVDQLDLNCRESVLLYSGILQAVPLVGGAMKFTSVLNRVARKFRKDFLRKPFSTVLKSAIQADFIDRFVIGPTLDDARRFADATNYVLRVLQTARERNAAPTALESSTMVTYDDERVEIAASTYQQHEIRSHKRYVESKAFLYLDVSYDVSAVSPIQLWANRVGLTRPLDSVWDLVPFSFVLDYFTRAGDFISQLGDEMTDIDGLKGRVGRIRDCWGTLKRVNRLECSGLGPSTWQPQSSGCYAGSYVRKRIYVPGTESLESSDFSRFRIPNPFSTLASIQEKTGGFVHLSLSPTRIRTLAELIIQAKL
jgi:hypothetical protein